MDDRIAQDLVQEFRQLNHHLKEIIHLLKRNRAQDDVVGGTFTQIEGDQFMNPKPRAGSLVPIQPGNTPVFQVAPTYSGAPFNTLAAQAAVSSSDPANFPVQLVSTDPTGLTFSAPIPSTATPVGNLETVTVTWTYTNTDGTVGTVTGTVTEQGIVDDVTGGTFAQIA